MKFYRINNFYLNKNEKSYFDSSLIVIHKDAVYNLGEIEFEDLYLLAKENSDAPNQSVSLNSYVESLIKSGELFKSETLSSEQLVDSLQSPIYPQEVWAAGVTYSDSMRERQAESDSPDVYAKVYNAERPEIFFKGTGDRMQPPEDELGIRKDSGWDVPESELAVVIIDGDIAGFTIGNDMSSRSIEGENPLYLPQAKVYNKSFSIGPCIISSEGIDPQNLKVSLKIFRDKEWNVPNHIFSIGKLSISETLFFISFAALLVNVTAKIWPGVASCWIKRCNNLNVNTLVFPLPAPAKIKLDPFIFSTACLCWKFNKSR